MTSSASAPNLASPRPSGRSGRLAPGAVVVVVGATVVVVTATVVVVGKTVVAVGATVSGTVVGAGVVTAGLVIATVVVVVDVESLLHPATVTGKATESMHPTTL